MISIMKVRFLSLRRKKSLAIFFTSLLVFLVSLGFFMYEGTKKTVAMSLDGRKRVVKTHAETIGQMLREINIQVRPNDYISLSTETKINKDLSLVFKTACQVTISIDGKKKTYFTTAKTVGSLLNEMNIQPGVHDFIKPGDHEKITDHMQIEIKKGLPIYLFDQGKRERIWSTSTTVADFLKQQGVKLNNLDRIKPGLNSPLKPNGQIHITRVQKVSDVVEEAVHFKVLTKKDSLLREGERKIIQAGKNGLDRKRYEVTIENGKEVKRDLTGIEHVKLAKNQIVSEGKQKVSVPSSVKGISGGKEIIVSATAYTASCSGCSGHTATGVNLRANPGIKLIAVDPRIIPLGTKVYVEGYGYAVAGDTGGGIKGNRIDVLFSSKSAAYQWGSRRVKVRILGK